MVLKRKRKVRAELEGARYKAHTEAGCPVLKVGSLFDFPLKIDPSRVACRNQFPIRNSKFQRLIAPQGNSVRLINLHLPHFAMP